MNSNHTWNVHVPKSVGKTLEKFPKQEKERILEILRSFEVNPWEGDIIKIKGEANAWRRRIGNYRIFYSILRENNLIEIKEVERRTTRTY